MPNDGSARTPIGYTRSLVELFAGLWAFDGKPSYRAIAKRIPSAAGQATSPGYINQVMRGRRNPSPDMAAAIVDALRGDRHARERARRYAEEATTDKSAVAPRSRHAGWRREGGSSEMAVPRNLPAAPRNFVGRARELAALTEMLGGQSSRDTATVSVISGSGGTGKTWLALHWAHEHLESFPDGQVHLDLRGFDVGEPVPTATALRGILAALGADPRRTATTLDELVRFYRSLTAGRRMLIVLDNARDTAQVAALLPTSATSAVIVTSRNRMTGLVSAHGALFIPISAMNSREARRLLARRLGSRALAAEPGAVTDVLAACAGLPLALGIVAARVATNPSRELAPVAAELADARTRLTVLDDEPPDASLRTVLACSYTALPTASAQMFKLLGVAIGPDITAHATAALCSITPSEAERTLHELEEQSLVEQDPPGRWRMHDLIRLYAQERADAASEDPLRALRHLVNFYVRTATQADQILEPDRRAVTLAGSVLPPGPCEPLADQVAAQRWLEAEHVCLAAAQTLALAHEWHTLVWQLAWALDTYYGRRGRLEDLVDVWHAGYTAAGELGDALAQARAARLLGETCAQVDRHDDAANYLNHALVLVTQSRDLPGQAHTHYVLARASELQGDDQQALNHASSALEIYQAIGNPEWVDEALNAVGWYHAKLGHHQEALPYLEAALALHRRNADREGEAAVLDSLGYLAHHAGRPRESQQYYRKSLAIRRALGHSYDEAGTLDRLGDAYAATNVHRARHTWQKAVTLLQQQHRDTYADRVQRKLDDSTPVDRHGSRPS